MAGTRFPVSEYYSRVDWWIVALLAGSILFCIALGVYLLGKDATAGGISIGIGIFVFVLLYLLSVPCKYTLHDDHMVVQAGLIKYKVMYSDIRSVARSSNPLSAPAFSLRRIKLKLKKGFLLISPKNRDPFMADLASRMQ